MINNTKKDEILQRQKSKYCKKERKKSIQCVAKVVAIDKIKVFHK